MNKVILVGRFTRDPEVKYAESGTAVVRFTIAVDRRYKKEGEQQADFISCLAFGKTAEFIEKYFKQGNRIGIDGRIQTGSYTNKDGAKVYTTEVLVENTEFVESKASGENQANKQEPIPMKEGEFINIPDGLDEELPFN